MKLLALNQSGDDGKYTVMVLATRDEAQRLLAACWIPEVEAEAAKPAPAAQSTNGAANGAPAAAPAAKSKKAAQQAEAAKPEPKAEPASKPKAAPAPDDDEPAVGDEPPLEPKAKASPKEEPKPEAKKVPESVGFDLDGELPEELVTASRLKNIIVFFQDRGIRTKDQLIDACQKVQNRVPILAKMESIPDRVQVALEVLGQA